MSGSEGILEHTLERPPGLVECQTVLDVGTGVRPMQWYKPARHQCVEPCEAYAAVLRAAGYGVLMDESGRSLTALEALRGVMHTPDLSFEAIYLLDVIEHLEKDEGREVLRLAQQVATVQIVVFTPDGFKAQTTDAWGYGEHAWQTHRSGWTESDFLGWRVSRPSAHALFALWDAP